MPISRKLRLALLAPLVAEMGGSFTAEKIIGRTIAGMLEPGESFRFVTGNSHARSPIGDAAPLVIRRNHALSYLDLIRESQYYWKLDRRKSRIPPYGLEKQLLSEGFNFAIALAMFAPLSGFVRMPFATVCWDLGHRDWPELPETGQQRTFQQREKWFQTVIPRASAVLTDSHETSKRISATYGILKDRVFEVPLTPEGECNYSTFTDRSDDALYPAQFWSHKNHIILIEALAYLRSRGLPARRIQFTGSDRGFQSHVSDLAESKGVSDLISFCGFVTPAVLDGLYASSGVTVMPSLLGPTNLPPIEALMRGCAVAVSSRFPLEGYSGTGVVYCDPFDVDQWAQVLRADQKLVAPSRAAVQEFTNLRRSKLNESVKALLSRLRSIQSLAHRPMIE